VRRVSHDHAHSQPAAPNATVGVAYNQQITANPAGTYNLTVVSEPCRETLTLSATGLLWGRRPRQAPSPYERPT